ncbi:flagellar biosynthesis protein FlhF, partial [Xanthomonas perforans]
MKIKRFVAPDMRTAFRMVREEHGPDAVILSNRRTAEGIEIVAASNYDEELVQRALETARSDTPAPAQHQQAPAQPAPAPQAPAKPSAPVHALLKPSADTEASQRQRVASAADDMIAAMALRQPVSVPRQAPVAAPVRTASIPSPAAQALAHAVAVTAAPRQEHALSAVPEQLFADFLTTAPVQRPAVPATAVQAPAPVAAATVTAPAFAAAGQDDDAFADEADFDLDDALPQILPPAALPP